MLAVRRRTITLRCFPPVGGPRKRRPGALAASSEGHLRMTDRGLGVMLCSPRQGRFGRRPARRNPGGEVSVFGVPLRAWPAHVVQVRPIRTAGSAAFAETLPQPADGFNEISQHQTLPLPLHEGSSWASLPPNACSIFKRPFHTSVRGIILKNGVIAADHNAPH